MKFFLLIGLLALGACGGSSKESPNSNGSSFGPQEMKPEAVTASEKSALNEICEALVTKSRSELESARVSLSYQKTNCEGEFSGTERRVYPIVIDSGVYRFQGFPISSIETHEQGIMASLCTERRNPSFMRPFIDPSGTVNYFTIVSESPDCTSSTDQICINVQKGTLSTDGKDFITHTAHTIGFKISMPYRGFYTTRTIRSSAFCANNKISVEKVNATF